MNSPQPIVMFRVLVVSFNLILLGAFLALSSLGAGSGSGRENRLMHIRRLLDCKVKENTAVAIYNQITFPVLEI